MSVGSLGVAGPLAGSALAQSSGTTVERAKQDAASFQRQVDSTRQAADASGIGQTTEDHQTSDRDADGRTPWEQAPRDGAASSETEEPPIEEQKSKDPTGDAGTMLDLTA
jgi:hypothetical protein